jgi:hypothetical protein
LVVHDVISLTRLSGTLFIYLFIYLFIIIFFSLSQCCCVAICYAPMCRIWWRFRICSSIASSSFRSPPPPSAPILLSSMSLPDSNLFFQRIQKKSSRLHWATQP